METIVTGTPGNGKTAHVIDLVFFDKESIWFPLEKYVDGIADLKLEHYDFPDVKSLKSPSYVPLAQVDSDEYAIWLPDNPRYHEFVEARATAKTAWDLWFLWATPNSVLIVDEAQRYLRPKPSGSAVPLAIQMIEYHRHFGVHLIFITQKERLLHSNVRMLCGQHIHLTNGWRGGHRFEWPECKDSESKSDKKDSAHGSYSVPKHVFPFYKSTVSVLSVQHKKPFFVYMLYGSLLLLPVLGYFVYSSFVHKKPAAVTASAPVAASGVISIGVASGVDSSIDLSGSGVTASQTLDYVDRFKPVVPARPETARAYDALRQVVTMPVISACLQSAKSCICYTQQGSRVADMSQDSCVDYVSNGVHFNPYIKPSERVPVASAGGFGSASLPVVSAPSKGLLNIPEASTPIHPDRTRLLGGQ